ncbi:hypothetical protein LG302_06355 [Halomonas organivorans]
MTHLTAERPSSDLARGLRPIEDAARRPRVFGRRQAPWWLAGLLVGCLLPAGLAQLDSTRHVERVIQICILAPALIRASSRLQARRRATRRWPPRPRPASIGLALRHEPMDSPPCQAVAAHDVLTRRGPPVAGRP